MYTRDNHYPFPLEPLPYAWDALEPCINARTLRFHHDRHLAAYVDGLNRALAPYPQFHGLCLECLLAHIDALPEEIQIPVARNAGGVYNHQLYFESMTGHVNTPDEPLYKALRASFGSYEAWKTKMGDAALSVFGSGWAWLVTDPSGNLQIQTTPNQDTPLPLYPLLPIDLWEHAYYLQYQNLRSNYVENWFHLINWAVVGQRYSMETAGISAGRL